MKFRTVTVNFKDGTKQMFRSRSQMMRVDDKDKLSVDYVGSFVTVTDEYGTTTAFPESSIMQVVSSA